MATISYLLQSQNNPANIYVRLSISRKNVFKRKTGYIIDPKNWSRKTNLPIPKDTNLKNLKTDLSNLKTEIEKRCNSATTNGIEISGNWLHEQINSITGKQDKTDKDLLTNYVQLYIDNLPYKEFPNGKRGVAIGTIQKYTTLKNKIGAYQKHKKKHFYVKNVDLKFRNDFLKYLIERDKLNPNSAGRYIRFLKTICLDAQLNGYEVSKQLKQIKGFTEKASKVFLTFDELSKIETTIYKRTALENAKDWLIIGCYTGQRVSDLLAFTCNIIKVRNGIELIEFTQKKTGKRVAIPIHPKIKGILDKHNGQFPTQLSAQKFNKHLKDLCKIAEINEPTDGAKMDKEIGRKIQGIYPKYELITSHVCRRSFASNFYGEIPTALLMSITAHSTEQQFLEYIGKTTNDFALQIAEYWSKHQLRANDKTPMAVIKKAN